MLWFKVGRVLHIGVLAGVFLSVAACSSEGETPDEKMEVTPTTRLVVIRPEPPIPPEAFQKQMDAFRSRATQYFEELMAFKDDPQFHQVGYGQCCRYHQWAEEVEALGKELHEADMPNGSEYWYRLFMLKQSVGRFWQIGWEYVRSNGAETDLTNEFMPDVRAGLYGPWPERGDGRTRSDKFIKDNPNVQGQPVQVQLTPDIHNGLLFFKGLTNLPEGTKLGIVLLKGQTSIDSELKIEVAKDGKFESRGFEYKWLPNGTGLTIEVIVRANKAWQSEPIIKRLDEYAFSHFETGLKAAVHIIEIPLELKAPTSDPVAYR